MLAVGLAGCASTDNSPQAQCERQAEDDPTVIEIYTRSNGTYTDSSFPAYQELKTAKQQATIRCMRGKGLLPPGGVQPVQR